MHLGLHSGSACVAFIAVRRRRSGVPVLLASILALGGCASRPSHTARFWMSGGQAMVLQVEGAQPTVQLRPDFGPLKDVEWKHAGGVARFEGVPPNGELQLTLREGDLLRFADQLGTRVELKLWDATGYTLTSVESGETVATAPGRR